MQRGDTLFGIARRYGLTVDGLAQANPDLHDRLRAGQLIRLPASESAVRTSDFIQPVSLKASNPKSDQPLRYTIMRGDTLSTIAERFEVSLADITAWNPAFRKTRTIRTGQSIIVGKP